MKIPRRCSSDSHRNETVMRLMSGWYVFWQSSRFFTLMWKMRTSLYSILSWWITKWSSASSVTHNYPDFGQRKTLLSQYGQPLGSWRDAGPLSRVSTTPHPYPHIASILGHIPHSTQLEEGLEDGLASWSHLCLYQILPLAKEKVDEPLRRTWAITEGSSRFHGCDAQKGSWRHTKTSTRDAIP